VWTGSLKQRRAHNPNVTLDRFAPLAAVPGVRWYNLQKGEAAVQARRPPPGMTLIDPTAKLTDFAETAALVSCLDLVISVDTSVVHLAGALGKPAWVPLAFIPDFRWLLGREDSPWYPTVRLFRQQRPGDWDGVFARIAVALQQYRSEHRV
jgi:hypothetical protein